MNLWHDIEAGPDAPNVVNVIVEIPKGSSNKYEYDKEHNLMKLDRVLFSPVYYPGDYGLIPKTLSGDGDPLDAMIISDKPTYPGILIEARVIGVLITEDQGGLDEKILCVIKNDPKHKEDADITGIDEHTLKEIVHFFEVYKHLEGKETKITGWKDVSVAKEVIAKAMDSYNSKFKKQH